MRKKRAKKIITIGILIMITYLILPCVVVPLFPGKAMGPTFSTNTLDSPGASRQRVMCIDDNNEALVRRLQVIESAQQELIYTTYNYGSDESSKDISAALLNAADRGVKVRILVDGMSGFANLNRGSYLKALAFAPNVEMRIYNPINLLTPWKLNYRMHDKYIVADDRVFILGGRNTHNLSLGQYQEKKDIDRDVLVYHETPQMDSALEQVKSYFGEVWSQPCTKNFKYGKRANQNILQELRDYYACIKSACPEAFEIPDWQSITLPAEGVSLITNGVEAENKAPVLWNSLCSLMGQGKEVMIQTPYIICNQKMYNSLKALDQQGTQVKVITNAVETGANFNGCVDYMNQKKNILKTGTEVYEYAGEQSTHTKTVLIDDNISVIGSFNMDMRSTYLDTEMMLVIRSNELNEQLRQLDESYMEQSRYVQPDGTVTLGSRYEAPHMGLGKQIVYGVLRVLTIPIRHLL